MCHLLQIRSSVWLLVIFYEDKKAKVFFEEKKVSSSLDRRIRIKIFPVFFWGSRVYYKRPTYLLNLATLLFLES